MTTKTYGTARLPLGWKWYRLGEIVENLDRLRVPVNRRQRERRPGDVPYYGATGQVGWIDDALFDEDLILLGEDGVQFLDPSARKAYRVSGRSWVNNHVHVLRPRRDLIVDGFLCLALNTVSYVGRVNGTTRLKLTQAQMNSLPIPVPPRTHQRRIIEAIEEEFSRIDAIEAELDATDRLNEQFRRALLRDAFAGRLVRTRLCSQAHDVANEGSQVLPTGWEWKTVAELGDVIRGVTFKKAEARPVEGSGRIPVLRSGNVRRDLVIDENLIYIPDQAVKAQQALRVGDLVVSVSNSRELVGKAALLLEPWKGTFGAFLSVIRPNRSVNPRYLAHFAASPAWRSSVMKVATATSNIANINSAKLKAIEVPVPPPEEQDMIVEAVDRELARIDEITRAAEVVRLQLSQARSATLHQAFTGRLVETLGPST